MRKPAFGMHKNKGADHLRMAQSRFSHVLALMTVIHLFTNSLFSFQSFVDLIAN